MQFWFCETCGKRLTQNEIVLGLGRDKKMKGIYCQQCSVGVMTLEFPALKVSPSTTSKPPTGPATVSRRSTGGQPIQVTKNPVLPGEFAPRDWSEAVHNKPCRTVRQQAVPTAAIIIGIAAIVTIGACLLFLSSGERSHAKFAGTKNHPEPPLPSPVPLAPSPQISIAVQPPRREQPTKSEPSTAIVAPETSPDLAGERTAQEVFDKLVKFEGISQIDNSGRIGVVEDFLKSYGETMAGARARVLLADLKKMSVADGVAEPSRVAATIEKPQISSDPTAQPAQAIAPPVPPSKSPDDIAASPGVSSANSEAPNSTSASTSKSSDATVSVRSPISPKPVVLPRGISLDLGGVRMDLLLIPAGEYMMGSDDGEANEKPAHKVKITRPFYMGMFLVTQAQFEKVMGKNPSRDKGDNFPVQVESYDQASEFCKLAGEKAKKPMRLPTEAEWEYACRAGTTTTYNVGNDEKALRIAGWYRANANYKAHPVGQKTPNAWGFYDMHGNVWQWCQDRYAADYYSASPVDDPPGPKDEQLWKHVLRGGSFYYDAAHARSSFRITHDALSTGNDLGFRVVVPADKP